MFGIFKKKKIKTPPEEIALIVEAVKVFVGTQLMFAHRSEQDLLTSKFTLGYLTGVCDAIAQRRGVPAEEHELVMTAVFASLYPLNREALTLVPQFVNDPEFNRGQMMGGQEMLDVLAKKITLGIGLTDYWRQEAS